MRPTPITRAVAGSTLALLLASCATSNLPPISGAGGGFQPLPDELALWDQARDEEDQLLDKVRLYRDPLLDSYLEDVVGRLNPPGMAANPEVRYRVRVVEDPTLNAFAYPRGALYVHTGLLARLENEDQLATVLGHEMTHVEGRHMLRHQRSAQNKQVGLTVLAVAAAVAVAGVEADAYDAGHWGRGAALDVVSDLIVGLGLQLAFLAAVNGYGRRLEAEADQGGFVKLAAAGYHLAEAPKVYEALLEDHGEPKKAEAFFFGSHPRLSERIQSTREYVAAHLATAPAPSAAPERDDDTFARRMRPVIRDDARLNLDLGRLRIAEDELDRVRPHMPDDPEVAFLTGRLRLAQAAEAPEPDLRKELTWEAEEAFRLAIRRDSEHREAHRELGLLLYRQDDFRAACAELRQYLALADDTDDETDDRIQDVVRELERDRRCR